MMTALILAGHDQFPEGLKHTGEFISGSEAGVEICPLHSEESTDTYKEKLLSTINQMDEDAPVIVLCDLIGGTPFKAALEIARSTKKQVRIIAGINLPGLLTGIMLKDSLSVDELVKEIIKETQDSVKAF
ncbi:hypothetical protein MUB24_19990 [Lederbergia sp. NSJ-179]|uniref:PTS sugar transporter subunit IIA n=1 Tax=Lederbergia sp. NSJ-179 TaxID=2931402 RepID=UPI001FD3E4E8|nr:hypothetical protein [Lederbergia sp. NSJ-179]MCJ7843115.1 hypothetical protein [Lederbergia sp. NSJ-179]